MSIQQDLQLALSEAITMSPCILGFTGSYNSGSTIATGSFSASVYKSYGYSTNYSENPFDIDKSLTDLSIMAKKSDISTWILTPKISIITLDGTKFLLGGVKTTLGDAVIWLSIRDYKSIV